MIVRSEFALAPASILSPSSRYRAVFLSTTTNVASAGTDIVLAIAIGDPPDLVIKTDTSTDEDPSMFAIKILFTLTSVSEAAAKISVVKVVVKAACTDSPVIDVTFTRFGFAVVYFLLFVFYPKTNAIAIAFPTVAAVFPLICT